MKRVFAFILAFICIFLSGCTANNFNQDTKAETEVVTVKEHKIRKFLNHSYWYANKNAEKILNLINAKDRNALKELFSQTVINEGNIDKQIDVLFDYVDGAFVDYEENPPGGSEYNSYGEAIELSYNVEIIAKTSNYEYSVIIDFILADKENEENIGVGNIQFIRTDYFDAYGEHLENFPERIDGGGIWCFDEDSVVGFSYEE